MSDTKITDLDRETEEARRAASEEWQETEAKLKTADELGEDKNDGKPDEKPTL